MIMGRLGSACALFVLALSGCEEAPQHSGLPACEPPGELVLERGLKTGFRALSEQRWTDAKSAFTAVLDSEPGHPEARAGLRAASTLPLTTTHALQHRGLIVGQHELQTQHPINHDRLRLETRAKEHAAAKNQGERSSPTPKRFIQRTPKTPAKLSEIDLVVLHATGTLTALERFVEAQYGAETTHFIIDWNGEVYQTLDIGLIAKHTGSKALDARSISIELVTPTSPEANPLPSGAEGVERPMSQRLRVQGKLTRNWGYTAPQMKSLNALLKDLVRLLPDLDGKLLGNTKVPLKALSQSKQAGVTGVIGRLHVDAKSQSPGPGFNWSALRAELGR